MTPSSLAVRAVTSQDFFFFLFLRLSYKPANDSTLSKKRNATNSTVVNFSVLLTGPRVLGDTSIRHVIDMIGVFIQAQRRLFQCVIPVFGASHGWSVVTITA